MTYVIGLPGVDVKDRACVDECPVDRIYEDELPTERVVAPALRGGR